MTKVLPLFPRCPICRQNLVTDLREPCGECIEAFGSMLRRGEREVTAEAFAAELARGDAAVAEAYARQRELARWSE